MDTLSSNIAPDFAPMVFWATMRTAAEAHAPEPIMATWKQGGVCWDGTHSGFEQMGRAGQGSHR